MNPSDNVESLDNRQKYELKLKRILDQKGSLAFGLNKSTSNLFRHREKSVAQKMDLSHFNQVIGVNAEECTAEIEGMATYEQIVDYLLPLGFMPTVVPELKTITLGGALTGIGIESSSFKYGLVHETVLTVDILTAEGEVVHCTPNNEHSDLFFGFPNSYGTLGYALKIKIRLQKTKPFVQLTHTQYDNRKAFFKELENQCSQTEHFNFIEGVVFSPTQMVITTGVFIEAAEEASDYTNMNIYFKSLLSKTHDTLSVKDYIWRWDTDWFWCSKHFGAQIPWIRKLYGKERLRSTTYWKIRDFCSRKGVTGLLEKWGTKKEAVIQDVEIPIENADPFLEFFQKEIKISPVWVCPTRAINKSAHFSLYDMDPEKLYINFGFWDVVPTTEPKGHYNKLIESTVHELKGKKSLYSDSYYNEETFWSLYNKPRYEELKKKYDPKGKFKDLYTKCVRRR